MLFELGHLSISVIFFAIGFIYVGIYDLIKTKLSMTATILMSVGVIILFLTETINLDAFIVALTLALGILTFPIIIASVFKRIHIYFWDCLVLTLLIFMNTNRLVVFVYYLIFLPVAFVTYLLIKRKNIFAFNEVPFLFVLLCAVSITEVFLYCINNFITADITLTYSLHLLT
ncbi:MAG: hypothetical protein QXQ68_07430 [Candidatus Nitrosocaldaceae archaeon]